MIKLRIWSYAVSEYDETSVSTMAFDGGYVNAETFDEAVKKVKGYMNDAWGKSLKLQITKLEYEHDVKIK